MTRYTVTVCQYGRFVEFAAISLAAARALAASLHRDGYLGATISEVR